jgi:predicted metal-dependent phosphoesterase TrpH
MGALALWLGGLLIGTAADRRTTPAPIVVNGYRVVAADLHVHAYPGDGLLPAWELSREARRRQLDVIALTNHNQMWPSRLAAAVGIAPDVLVIPSEEVTTPHYHMAAIGLDHPVDWRQDVVGTAAAVHAEGGAAIVAHPGRESWRAFDRAALMAVDGVEVAHPGMDLRKTGPKDFATFYARARAAKPAIAPIGSTDFHTLAPLGHCRTYLFVHDLKVAGVVDAIRSGRTVACDAHGRTYGDPALAAAVAGRCADAASLPLTSGADRAAVACALLGLALLMFVGRPGGPRPGSRDPGFV